VALIRTPFSARRLESSNLSLSSLPIEEYYVRFEVSTAVTMMIIIFWEMTPCGSYKNLFSAQRLESSNLSLSSLPIEE
jgi:hypothetical protein